MTLLSSQEARICDVASTKTEDNRYKWTAKEGENNLLFEE